MKFWQDSMYYVFFVVSNTSLLLSNTVFFCLWLACFDLEIEFRRIRIYNESGLRRTRFHRTSSMKFQIQYPEFLFTDTSILPASCSTSSDDISFTLFICDISENQNRIWKWTTLVYNRVFLDQCMVGFCMNIAFVLAPNVAFISNDTNLHIVVWVAYGEGPRV